MKIRKRNLVISLVLSLITIFVITFTAYSVQPDNSVNIQLAKTVSTDEFNSWTSFNFIDDPVMNDQFRWIMSQILYQKADLGECLEVAREIIPGNAKSWMRAWTAMAHRIEDFGYDKLQQGKLTSAGNHFHKASTYYRAALLHHEERSDPLIRMNTLKARELYRHANKLLHRDITPVEIPYEQSILPGYFVRSPIAKQNAPLLIVHQGRDAWPEDTSWVYETASKRGIHTLIVHAPGQGEALRLHNLHFRPDWEKVITPIVDFALTLPSIDKNSIALMGLSFGGALVPRALAFEHRLKLAIVNPGVLSWAESMKEHFDSFPGLMRLRKSNPERFNQIFDLIGKVWTTASWWLEDESWKQGVGSASELFDRLFQYDNTPIVSQITTPILIMDGTEERVSSGQSQKLYEALQGKKELMLFDSSTAAQLHCQNGALMLAADDLFDWLEDQLLDAR